MTSFTRRGAYVLFDIRVVLRASADAFVARAGQLVVRVSAPPVEGKANEAVIRTVARALGLARSDVAIVRGAGARTKTLRVPASAEAALRGMVK